MLLLLLNMVLVCAHGFRQVTVASHGIVTMRRMSFANPTNVFEHHVKSYRRPDTPKDTSTKPVIILDVEGVVDCQHHRGSTGLEYPKQLWDDIKMTRVGDKDIVYSPTVINKINAWGKVAEIKWLPGWGKRTEELAAIGLDPFPWITADTSTLVHDKDDAVQCTADTMTDDRLLIWMDKELIPLLTGGEYADSYHSGEFYYVGLPHAHREQPMYHRFKSVFIGPWCGLTPYHVELVDQVLADPTEAAGKVIFDLNFSDRDYLAPQGSNTRSTNTLVFDHAPF